MTTTDRRFKTAEEYRAMRRFCRASKRQMDYFLGLPIQERLRNALYAALVADSQEAWDAMPDFVKEEVKRPD